MLGWPTQPPRERALFEEVLFCFGRWDCPRAGVTSVDGSLMHFDSPFDPDLDDYVTEFYLWPATNEEVAVPRLSWGVVGLPGLEPGTNGLKVHCSAS